MFKVNQREKIEIISAFAFINSIFLKQPKHHLSFPLIKLFFIDVENSVEESENRENK